MSAHWWPVQGVPLLLPGDSWDRLPAGLLVTLTTGLHWNYFLLVSLNKLFLQTHIVHFVVKGRSLAPKDTSTRTTKYGRVLCILSLDVCLTQMSQTDGCVRNAPSPSYSLLRHVLCLLLNSSHRCDPPRRFWGMVGRLRRESDSVTATLNCLPFTPSNT